MWHQVHVSKKKQGTDEDRYYHLDFAWQKIMKDMQNLCKIVSKGFVEGFYYKPRVDYEVLGKILTKELFA